MKIFKRLLIVIICVLLVIGIGVTIQGYSIYSDAVEDISLEEKLELIRANESYVTLDELPDYYVDAVVSIEDRRYYEHGAIDIISIIRAIFTNVKNMELTEGGSTITQQVAKNIYFTQKKEATRKIAEIFMAFHMEANMTKKEILEIYVNTSYFGSGYYGIGEASIGYFGKVPLELDLSEATLLAGVPNAPSVYDPTKNPDLASQRQRQVIESMVENRYLTEEEASNIKLYEDRE